MKKVLFVIFFCLLMSNIANAQYAWVLWESYSNDGYLHWQVKDAFPSYEKCKQAQQKRCEWWKHHVNPENPDENSLVISNDCPDNFAAFYKDSSHPLEIEYKCLPNTIDPRK